jgi:hypothetical protein
MAETFCRIVRKTNVTPSPPRRRGATTIRFQPRIGKNKLGKKKHEET